MIDPKSPKDLHYNCVAWAMGDNSKWWWPAGGYYWPVSKPSVLTVGTFIELFELIGYECCDNGRLEDGYNKIAIFSDNQQKPTHVAKQLPSGLWTSKLGANIDVEHELLDLIQHPVLSRFYGKVAVIMKVKTSTS